MAGGMAVEVEDEDWRLGDDGDVVMGKYLCSICDSEFDSKSELEAHMEKEH
jgi:hypothetical protein